MRHRRWTNPEKRKRARELRANQTGPEKRVWKLVRRRRLGFRFRRQQVLGGFVVDFYCHELRLAVELDGKPHHLPSKKAADVKRDAIIEARGVRVFRLANEAVSEKAIGELILRRLSELPPELHQKASTR